MMNLIILLIRLGVIYSGIRVVILFFLGFGIVYGLNLVLTSFEHNLNAILINKFHNQTFIIVLRSACGK